MRTTKRVVVAGLLVVAGVLPAAGAAHADETHTHAHNGPRFALVDVGQIDDPMEDVLEHVALLGRNTISG
ncbi:hypothetical protein RND61_04760 [Streptomyces sp. TRM76323]|uniref:Secreted protein n=1 Tax=Streptomyces tamarix TaxID=3078565 RepID=A0ABU3QF42_9ACTN|nr:hypothetical protein [Streptomyces tamarix]MDT9681387.1 hypothetical protein [Streptomyces tamarix]